MGAILNEILSNFDELANKQAELEKPAIDESQFDLIKVEASQEEPARYLDNHIVVAAEDSKDVLMEKKLPFGLEREDLVEKAHPETVLVADGPHTSGVVDNQNEQHKKIVNMVNKQPTGNVFHDLRLADQVNELVAIADVLDSKGLYKEANEVEELTLELLNLKKKV